MGVIKKPTRKIISLILPVLSILGLALMKIPKGEYHLREADRKISKLFKIDNFAVNEVNADIVEGGSGGDGGGSVSDDGSGGCGSGGCGSGGDGGGTDGGCDAGDGGDDSGDDGDGK
ncbi:hypothetical protein HYW53_01890 [Candidatus Giovannonibacteria bacterium]|nr:hypothetical protein [Candidatus Giovannonibacteria bacterium]